VSNGKTIILSFDMEPDLGSWTSATRGVMEGTPQILQALKRHGVPATFFFVGREAEAHPAVVRQIIDAGHEIGCHTMFHETVGTPVYDVPVGGFMREQEIDGRLTLATDAIARVAGVRPVSFRAPRLFGSSAMLRTLDRLGYVADSSLPAYAFGRDFHPYHPDPDDWTREGSLNILEMPPFYNSAAADDGGRNRSRDQWPMLRLKGAQWFADLALRVWPKKPVGGAGAILVVYLHPWEFVAMPRAMRTDECSIVFDPFLHKKTGAAALAALDGFIDRMRAQDFGFATMRQAAGRFALPQKDARPAR